MWTESFLAKKSFLIETLAFHNWDGVLFLYLARTFLLNGSRSERSLISKGLHCRHL